MKVFYVFNEVGKNEVFSKEELSVENVGIEEWDDVGDFESDIIKDYRVYDGVGRIVVDDNVSEEEMLDELDRIDEELW